MKDCIKPKGYKHARKRYKGPLYWLGDFRNSKDFQGLLLVAFLIIVCAVDFVEPLARLVEWIAGVR